MTQQTLRALPGSLHTQWVRCGRSWCRCSHGCDLHGPYFYRFYREAGKQHKEYVPKGQIKQVRAAIQLWGSLHPPISSIETSLRQINRIYKTLTESRNMKEEDQEIEDVSQ